jgi:hypothetical protein
MCRAFFPTNVKVAPLNQRAISTNFSFVFIFISSENCASLSDAKGRWICLKTGKEICLVFA